MFVRFHAAKGNEAAAAEALRAVVAATRQEAGCQHINAFQRIRDPQIFYIHSRWKSEEALQSHAQLPHTVSFLKQMDVLTDQPREAMRTELIG